ncbi:putative phage abortive infection protein [Flavobacterium seoulense]|nr:putative phage abortive infection protein [Flavobacterium seoulense]
MLKFKDHKLEYFILIIGLIFIHAFLMCNAFDGKSINSENANQFGSFIGGYVGSIFTLFSIFLLIITLRDQARNNFENNFLELVKFHRENVDKMEIKQHRSLKVFVMYTREFRKLLTIVKEVAKAHNLYFNSLENKRTILNITYLSFFFGTGPNSSRVLQKYLKDVDEKLIDNLISKMNSSKEEYKKSFGYTPFEGHQSRLGHYFRHLYHTVNFVHNSNYSQEKKRELLKILRSQLTNHEQAILYFNSLSSVGKDWDNKNLIRDYKLIKNLPEGFIDEEREINPKLIYDFLYEYEE